MLDGFVLVDPPIIPSRNNVATRLIACPTNVVIAVESGVGEFSWPGIGDAFVYVECQVPIPCRAGTWTSQMTTTMANVLLGPRDKIV